MTIMCHVYRTTFFLMLLLRGRKQFYELPLEAAPTRSNPDINYTSSVDREDYLLFSLSELY